MIIDEIAQAFGIALAVATFLLNSDRALKAIELCKESLGLLHNQAPGVQQQFGKLVYGGIYQIMFEAHCLIRDNTSALTYGRKLLGIYCECGKKGQEGYLSIKLAEIHKSQNKFVEAKELSERAIAIMREIGNKKGEAIANSNLGMFHSLGEYVKATECLEKSLVIARETGDKTGEAALYGNLGTLFRSVGEYVKAKEYLEKALVITGEIGDRVGEAALQGNLGTVFQSLGEYAKAKEYLEKTLAISMEIGDRAGEARSYGNLGTVFQSLGEYVTAKEYLEKALSIETEIGDRQGEATCYGNLGTVFQSLGEYVTAKECLEKSLAIAREIGDRTGEAALYGNLGIVFQNLGEYVKAKEYLEKALAIRIDTGDRKGEAADYGNLGTVFQYLGEYVKAKEHLEQALAIRIDTGDRKGEAADYGNLGTVFRSLGEYVKAKEYLEKALAINMEIGDRAGEGRSYGNLGTVFHSLGEHVKAKEYHEKALAIYMESGSIGDRQGEATCYGNLGTVFQSLGEYVKAKEYLVKSLGINTEIGDKAGQASCYGNLGTVFHSLGECVKAKEYLQKALAINMEIGDKAGEARCYANLGTVFQSFGEYVKAKEYLEKALAINMEIGDTQEEARSYGNLGTVFLSLGEYVKAKEYLEKALAINMEIGNKQEEAALKANLGTVFQSLGEYVQAKECLEKALAINMEIGDKAGEEATYVRLGTLFQCLGESVTAEVYLKKALSVSQDTGDAETESKCYYLLSLTKLSQEKFQEAIACLFRSIQKSEELRSSNAISDQMKISFAEMHVPPYELLSELLCAAGNPNNALYVAELGRARALADLMTTQYSAEKHISADPQSWIGIENVMTKESNCTCLYISYHGQRVFLWILKTSGVISFRKVTVDKSFRSFFPEKVCEDGSVNDSEATESDSSQEESLGPLLRATNEEDPERTRSLSLLHEMLIKPVSDLLDEPEIILVPDRNFYRVPFAALLDESGKYLSETFRIRIVPSLTTLQLIQDSPADYHSQTGALIVGDPEVGDVIYNGCLNKNFVPLPGARKEAEMIGRLLGDQPLLGQHARKEAVLQRMNSVSLIHFAAHGIAERGEIALAPPGSTHGIPQEDDYILKTSDISKVQLRAKLVVLRCHSARGQITTEGRTEGVVGIARAFLGSGARSVLVALRPLEDSTAERLMSRFYEHLVRGESASESLHKAMKWMRDNGFTKICDWAPFTLIGDDVKFDFGK